MITACMCFSEVQGTTSRLEMTEMIRLDVPFYVAVMVALLPVNVVYSQLYNLDSFIYAEAVSTYTIGWWAVSELGSPSVDFRLAENVAPKPNTKIRLWGFLDFSRWDLDLKI